MADDRDPAADGANDPVDAGGPMADPAQPYAGDPDAVEDTSDDDAGAPAHRRTNWPLRIAKWLGIAVVAVLVLVAAVIFGLDTAPGRRFAVDQIEKLEFENGMKIGIGRIDGSLYGQMTIRDLTIADPRGVFLRSPEIAIDYRPFDFLLNNHLDLRSAVADQITLLRLPQFNETPPSDDPLLPDIDIDIGRLRIARFVAEAPVSGERRVAAIDAQAHIADGRAQLALNAATLDQPGSTGGDRVALRLDAVPQDNRLDLDLTLDAPADGVIVALSGQDQAIAARIAGRGDWQAWNGRLTADLGGAPFAQLLLSARDGTFGVRGPTRIARLVTGPTAQLLGPITNVDFNVTPEDRRIQVTGNASSDAFRLNANGVVDLAESAFDDLRLGFVLLKPSILAPNLSGSGLRGQLVLDGAFRTPGVAYTLNANRVAFNDIGVDNLVARGAARVNADRIVIPVDARAARITGLDVAAGGTLTNVRLNGDLAIQGTRILSDNMRIRSDRIDATAIIVADTSTGLYTGAINGRIDNYRLSSVGVFNIDTNVDLRTEGEGFALVGRVRLRSTQLFNDSVRNFLGGNAVAAANVRYGGDGVARFSGLTLNAPLVRITRGEGSYSPDGQIRFDANAVTEQYGPVGVRVAGTISNPRATITATNPGFGLGLANLRADITGSAGGYNLIATADTDYGPLTADVTLGTGAQTQLTINRGNLAGIDFAGQLTQTAAGPFAGRLTADGRGLGGVVRLDAVGQYQGATANLRARNTTLPGPLALTIGAAIVDARVVLYDTPYIVADAQIAQTSVGGFTLQNGRAIIDYRGGTGRAKLFAEGTSGVPFRVAANADLTPELWRVMATGRARGVEFATTNPARIRPGLNGDYELLPTQLKVGPGSVRLAGRYGDGMMVQARLDRLNLDVLNAFAPGLGLGGTATGAVDFAQSSSTAFPRADARLAIADFTRTTAAAISQPVDINFAGQLLTDGGEARAVLRRRGTVIGRMVANLSPLGPGAGAWTTRLMAAPLTGGIRYNGPADTLFSFAGQPDQTLNGPIGLAADFSGRLQNPQLAGIVRSNNLVYENQTYGTRLTNLALNGSFSGTRLQIEQLRANAGNGSLTGQGFIGLSAEQGYPMDLRLTLANAELADSDALSAVATGDIALTKRTGEAALVSGDLLLPEARYQIVRQGAAEVPQLTGVRFRPPAGPPRITGNEPAEQSVGILGTLRYDIDLRAPERLYVSGMGLESEWSADFTIGGTQANPTLAGDIDLIRGTLGFAGRSFEVTEGAIRFTGGQTLDPTIRIAASDDIEDVTVNVNITGRAFDPQIAFSSTPGLPQDEIVSRILFGNSVGELSALQAVQLASSLNSLRGSGGGLNPLGKLRSATGIDRLRVLGADEATGRGMALAAGQYITDDVYLELITDARGFTATQLEIALSRALSVLSQAGGSGLTNVSVRYKKNY